uniref:Anaphase-promoting complex subunit 11 n=1 Tax=Sarcophilus harrisii TaxID=9305 RepID=A0A7N4V6F2_SARHA
MRELQLSRARQHSVIIIIYEFLVYRSGQCVELSQKKGKVPGDDCPLVWGQCSHCFHMHCILKWLNSQQVQQHCPMCRQEWKFKE